MIADTFRTVLPIVPSEPGIEHTHSILCIGSCFSDNIGNKLLRAKMQVLSNPFGVVFNPVSIAQQLRMGLEGEPFPETDFFQHQGLWRHWGLHSQMALPNLADTLHQLNQLQLKNDSPRNRNSLPTFIHSSQWLFITLGTAWVYVLKETGQIVANCHKMPADRFTKRLLTIAECTNHLKQIIEQIQIVNPGLQVIVTVSPVRHLRDGFIENQRSKARLLLAAEDLEDSLPYVHYYPAYELLLDDLRDYRFFSEDRLHPSKEAIDYVWAHFQETCMTAPTRALIQEVEQIQRALEHRPLHPQTEAHQAFLAHLQERIESVEKKHPYISI